MLSPSKTKLRLQRRGSEIALASGAILLQYLVLIALSPQAFQSNHLLVTTVAGCLAATVLAILLIRGANRYPGVEASGYIVPCFSAAFGLLLIAFILGRLEYSRILLTSSFLVNLALFFVLYSVGRRAHLSIGVIPEGHHLPLLAVGRVSWRVLRSPDDMVEGLDAIAVDLRSDLSDAWERRLAEFALQDLPVLHSKHLMESLTGKVELEHLSENSFGTLSPLHAYRSLKHGLDFIAALGALLVLWPLLLVVALIVRLDSPGPILFRQVRIGYQGKPFRMIKFRTMTAATPGDAPPPDDREAAKTKAQDRRVTRPGAFLRRSRIDELPQILNILRGQMSWIGPRPEAEILSVWYESEIPFYRYRHIVRPGITGWAQVNQGHVAEVSEVQSKLHYDFFYIKQFSPWIDLLIVIKTIRTMLTGFGAK